MSLIDVRNLSFSYEGSAETVFENVSFQLDTNWRLGLVGRNGRGKTTLLRLLQGALPCGGQIHLIHLLETPFARTKTRAALLRVSILSRKRNE